MKDPGDPKNRPAESRAEASKKPKDGMDNMGDMARKPVERGEDKPGGQQAAGGDKDGPKNQRASKDGKKADGKNADAAAQKDFDNAVQDLTSADPNKQQAARDKLDKQVGKDLREALEKEQKERKAELDKLQEDLKSSDEATRDAAKKRLQEMQEQARKELGKANQDRSRELSREEIEELAKKARDLNSKDDERRKSAEQALDDKLGKEGREKLQEEMKKRAEEPGNKFGAEDDQKLQKKIDDLAKNMPRAGQGPITDHASRPGASSEPPKGPMEDDPRNRAKTAQLQLEEFEKHRYDHDLHEKLGWSEKQYGDFLNAQRERAEELRKEADAFEAQRDLPKSALPDPTIVTQRGGKVESRDTGAKIEAKGTPTFRPPPGFGGAAERFVAPRSKKP
jgi:hypothetical protein